MSRGLAMVFAFSIGFGAFMFVFALTVQDGLHADALHGGLAILPMALMFFAGSLFAPRLIGRFGRAALSAGAIIQLVGLAALVAVVVSRWPHVHLWDMAVPLALSPEPAGRCCSPACFAACWPMCRLISAASAAAY